MVFLHWYDVLSRIGVKQDYKIAFKWFWQAEAEGYLEAQK